MIYADPQDLTDGALMRNMVSARDRFWDEENKFKEILKEYNRAKAILDQAKRDFERLDAEFNKRNLSEWELREFIDR
jgi:hypothetical protein